MAPDVRRILISQGLRAFVYGFGSVLLGASLKERGWPSSEVGILLAAIVAGTALMSILVGLFGDRIGRRRFYGFLYLGLAGTGVAFGTSSTLWVLVLVALFGTLSTEVNDSGPFTSLEQAMLPSGLESRERTRVFGRYNIVAVTVGSLGALATGGPHLARHIWPGVPNDQRFFLVFIPVGIAGFVLAKRLTNSVEEGRPLHVTKQPRLQRSKPSVIRLAALFATDSFGGGFVVQSFIAYWFSAKFGVKLEILGVMFFIVGLLQAGSFIVATRLAERFGLLNVMIFTHLPSNVFLAAIPLAPTFPGALALLFARFSLSQMDVPTRQAYVVSLVDANERTAASAFTNTARYAVRPFGPALAGASQKIAFGMPFFIAGGVKVIYDAVLWAWFRHVPLAEEATSRPRR
ncbi:MAG: MFS transporter [Actinomycetota bacterium]|nr:MFS transporter [Actinomycetota bacterium]